MGTDNLFNKRKAKKPSRNNLSQRQTTPGILIVCEGTKTEPSYFADVKNSYRLTTLTIKSSKKSDPLSLVQHAKELASEQRQNGNPYDQIYCVFDKDNHANYPEALNAISQSKGLTAIPSVPCFEYWLLLHFEQSTKPYTNSKEVLTDLKKYWPGYTKNQANSFTYLQDQLEQALTRADQAQRTTEQHNTDNPSTRMPIIMRASVKVANKK